MGHLGAANIELVCRRNGELEAVSIAHHVEGRIAHQGEQPDHAQRVRFTHQDVTADLLILGDLAFFLPADGSVDVNRGVQRLDAGSFLIDACYQLLFGGGLQFGRAGARFHHPSAEQASRFPEKECDQANCGEDR